MANRRVPLANVPNAANSPFRAVAAAASKRSRPYNTAADEGLGEQPPAKRQVLEFGQSTLQTPLRRAKDEERIFNKRTEKPHLTAFDRKLLAAKDTQAEVKVTKQDKTVTDDHETLRQWQKHYRKAFPAFVFYFESLPEDMRRQCSKRINGLGAREEKFFSKAVTHIITTRSIPTESEASTPTDSAVPVSTSNGTADDPQPRTINPTLLEKPSETPENGLSKGKFTFEVAGARRSQAAALLDADIRRQNAGTTDILIRARDMGMKIWQLQKLQKILTTIYTEDFEPTHNNHNTRSNVAPTVATTRPVRQADLSKLLRNEQLNGPSDRDSCHTSDIISFKGPHIYIHDMNEKTKPIMVREYGKVQNREDGAWPQFRSVSQGKCPFVEESIQDKQAYEKKMQEREARAAEIEEKQSVRRTRAAFALETANKMEPPPRALRKQVLGETENGANLMVGRKQGKPLSAVTEEYALTADPAKPSKNFPPSAAPRFHGGEPVASGVQPSNITSAIRSQMISSTAAAPGAKAGTSRNVHELKRKVFERNSGPSLEGLVKSQRGIDAPGIISVESNASVRLAKQKAQEKLTQRKKLGYIEEEQAPSEDEEEEESKRRMDLLKIKTTKAKAGEKRELKPGYCENCREKFDDFEDHTIGRKHRKFATTQQNWAELDSLLSQLVRPLKEPWSPLGERTPNGIDVFLI